MPLRFVWQQLSIDWARKRPRRVRATPRRQIGCAEPLEPRSLLSVAGWFGLQNASFARAPLDEAEVAGRADEGAEAFRFDTHRISRRPQITLLRNIVYRIDGGFPLALDVYEPPGHPPPGGWPALLAIHGGGWYRFNKEQYGSQVGPALAEQGFVVVAPDFTQTLPGLPAWPANFEDLRAALAWTGQNAGRLGINSNKIGAIGESSGAHLATLLGVYPNGPVLPDRVPPPNSGPPGALLRIGAVVDFSGPTDLAALVSQSPAEGGFRAEAFLGGTPGEIPGRFAAASPLSYVSSASPPMLIVHGSADTTVPLPQSEELAAALAAAGVPHQLIVVPGVGHDDRGLSLGRADFLPEIVAFLRTYL